jgi:hypothetical protein
MAIKLSDIAKSNTSLIFDNSPSLSADLDTAGFDILNSVGQVTISGISYPDTDGTSGQVIMTDGSGNLTFQTVTGGGTSAVDSVFGRTGAIIADENDYAAFYATTTQGALANTALQSGDDISELNNDSGFITAAQVPADAVPSVFSRTGAIVADENDYAAFYATTAQGDLADTALQPNDPISELDNDTGFITAADIPADAIPSVFGRTGAITAEASDYASFYATTAQGDLADTALQSGNNVSLLVNDAGYITAADIPPDAGVASFNGRNGAVAPLVGDYAAFYATIAQGDLADTALQSGNDISELNNDVGYITATEVPPSSINDLTDVDAPFPVTGDILLFDGTTNLWQSSTTKIGAEAQKLYVDALTGDDNKNTGSVYKPFRTISRALDEIGDGTGPESLFPGWIISVASTPAPYDENLVLPKWRILSFASSGVVRVGSSANNTGNVTIPYLNMPAQGVIATQFTGTYSSALSVELVSNYSQWVFAGDVTVDTGTDPEYLNTGTQIVYFWGATFNDFKWSGNTQPNAMSLYLKNCFVDNIEFPKLQLSSVEDSQINQIDIGTYEYFNNTIINNDVIINVGKTTLWPYRYPKAFCNSDVLGSITIPAGQELCVDDMTWNNLFRRNNLTNGLSPKVALDNGLVVILGAASSINTMSDVTVPSPAAGDVLKFDGVKWVAAADSSNQVLVDGVLYTVPPSVNKGLSTDKKTAIATSAGLGTVVTDRSALNPFSSDLLYLEYDVRSVDNNVQMGLFDYNIVTNFNEDPSASIGYISVNFNDNSLYKDGVLAHTFTQFTLDSTSVQPGVVQFAIDTTTRELWIGFNNVYEGADGEVVDPSNLTNPTTTLLAGANSSFATPVSLNSSVTSPAKFRYTAPVTFFNVKSVPVVSGQLDDLDDVIIVSPANSQYLGYNGTAWINKYISYNELTDKIGMSGLTDVTISAITNGNILRWNGTKWVNTPMPAPVADLNDLTDVSITSPQDGQVLGYDSINNQWVNTSYTVPSTLNDLTDTDIGVVKDIGQALVWDGTVWVNEDVDYGTLQNKPFIPLSYSQLSDVNMTTVPPTVGSSTVLWNGTAWVPTALPTNNSFSLTGLNDTSATATANGYLRWNTSGTNVVYETTIGAASITGLASVATSGDYDDLINTPTIPTNSSFSFVGLNDTLDAPTALGYLQWNAAGTSIIYSTVIPSTAVSGFATVATTGNYNDLSNKPTIPGNSSFTLTGLSDTADTSLAEAYLRWNASGASVEYVATIPSSDVTGLAAVATSGAFSDLSGTPTSASYTLTGLSDTLGTALVNGFLRWNSAGTQVIYQATIPSTVITGLATVATSGAFSDLSGTPTNDSYSFVGLNDTVDAKVANSFLKWDDTATAIEYTATIPPTAIDGLADVATSGSYSDLINTPTIPTNNSFTIVGLSDVTDTPEASGYLRWNSAGTNVVYETIISSGDIAGLAAVAISGSYTDLTDTPTIPTNNNFSFVGLNDTLDTPLALGYLQWNAAGTNITYSTVIPAASVSGLSTVATTGQYNDLLNKPSIPTNDTFTFLGLADTTDAPVNSGYLQWNADSTAIIYDAAIPASDVTGLAAVATSGNYNDLINAPFIPSVLDDLSNVSVASATTNQLLRYNGTTWINSDEVVPTINTLGGVVLSSPVNDQALVFNGTDWVNKVVNYDSLSNKPTIPTNSSFTLRGLSDTSSTAVANAYLQWNSAGTSVIYSSTIPSTAVTGFATVATSGSYNDLINKPSIPVLLSDLTDVITSSRLTNQALVWNGTTWVNQFVPYSSLTGQPNLSVYARIADISAIGFSGILNDATDVVITAPADGQSLIYSTASDRWINGNPVATVPTLNSIGDVDTTGVTNGQVLKWNSTTLTWLPADDLTTAGDGVTLGGLEDVSISGAIAQQALVYNGTSWINQNVNYNSLTNKPTIPTTLGSLTDVVTTGQQPKDLLQFNGTQWEAIRATLPADSNTVIVMTTGNDLTGDGSGLHPYATVKKGVEAATALAATLSPDDFVTVNILPGVYNEDNPIEINDQRIGVLGLNSTIVGVNAAPVIVLSSSSADFGSTLAGLNIIGNNAVGSVGVALKGAGLFNLKGVEIQNCDVGVTSTADIPANLQRLYFSSGRTTLCNIGIQTIHSQCVYTLAGALLSDSVVVGIDCAEGIIQAIPVEINNTNTTATGGGARVGNGKLRIGESTIWNCAVAGETTGSGNLAITATAILNNTIDLKRTSNAGRLVVTDSQFDINKSIFTDFVNMELATNTVSGGIPTFAIVNNGRSVGVNTGRIFANNSSPATPAYGFANSGAQYPVATYGMYSPSQDLVAFSTDSQPRLTISPTGVVNITGDLTIQDVPLATVATTGDYADLINTPAIPSTLGSLTDVSISAPTLDQILRYNGTAWINSNEVVPTINTIGGVTITAPVNDQALVYNGTVWVNKVVNYNSLSNKPTIPTNSSFALLGLSDTATPAVGNGYLRWNAGGTLVTYVTTIPTTVITGLAPVATSGSYTDLINQPTIPTNNSFSFVGLSDTDNTVVNSGYLRWNAGGTSVTYSATIPSTAVTGFATVATTGAYTDLTGTPTIPTNSSFTLLGLSDTATPAVNNGYLRWNGTGTQVTYSATIPVASVTGLATVATSGSYNDLINQPTIPTNSTFTLKGLSDTTATAVNSGYLRWNSTGTSVVYETAIAAANVTGLATVATSGNFNDLSNKPTSSAYSFLGLSDTNDTVVNSGYLLWNATGTEVVYAATIPTAKITGLATVATTGAYTDLTGTPTIPTNSSFTLLGLSDTATPAVGNGYLRWNAGGTQVTYSTTIASSSITGLASVATAGTLTSLTDTTITTPAQGQVLSYDNATSKWINSTPASAVTSVFTRTGAVVATSGDYNSTLITNSSAVVGTTVTAALNTLNTGKISTISGGTNGNFTVQATGGTVASSAFNSASFATAAQGTKADTALQSGSNITLLNNNAGFITGISAFSINALNDVDTATIAPTTGQGLVWNQAAGQWRPGSVGAGLVNSSITYYADMFQSPNNSDWPVATFASLSPDASFNSLIRRAFDDTTPEGVGFMVSIPAAATSIQLSITGRASSAATTTAIMRLYSRAVPNGTAVPAWGNSVTSIPCVINGTANYTKYTFTYALTTANLIAGTLYNFELARDAAIAGDTLVGDFNLIELGIGFI